MGKINQELETKLENGDFGNLNLDYWFRTHQYNYIYYAVCGCDKVINKDVLDFIVTYAEFLLLCPNEDSKHPKEDIIIDCEEILKKAIVVGSKHQAEYRKIVEPLFFSTNETVRLWCWANLDIKNRICLNEESPRIHKIAKIREEFDFCWQNNIFTQNTKLRIEYFAKACEFEVIECVTSTRDDEFTSIKICCSLFSEFGIFVPKFDIDVFDTIQDKRFLGYCLNNMYEEGFLKFKKGVRLPKCFIDTSDKHLVRIRRPLSFDVFNKMYSTIN